MSNVRRWVNEIVFHLTRQNQTSDKKRRDKYDTDNGHRIHTRHDETQNDQDLDGPRTRTYTYTISNNRSASAPGECACQRGRGDTEYQACPRLRGG